MGMRRRQRAAEKPRVVFQQCSGCDYDFVAGTGTRSCGWYDCPYLPEELKVNWRSAALQLRHRGRRALVW
jgi:hypothetical protein